MTHSSYGGILPDILKVEMRTLDENYSSLKEMIDNEVEEEIIAARCTTDTNTEDEITIRSCTLWSENSVYILIYASIGYVFTKESRNP